MFSEFLDDSFCPYPLSSSFPFLVRVCVCRCSCCNPPPPLFYNPVIPPVMLWIHSSFFAYCTQLQPPPANWPRHSSPSCQIHGHPVPSLPATSQSASHSARRLQQQAYGFVATPFNVPSPPRRVCVEILALHYRLPFVLLLCACPSCWQHFSRTRYAAWGVQRCCGSVHPVSTAGSGGARKMAKTLAVEECG